MAREEGRPVQISYARTGAMVRFVLTNVDEDELRAYVTALWLVLEDSSRIDMIRELAHYHEAPSAMPPEVSRAIANAYRRAICG